MKNNAKRALGLILCLLMVVSMMTCVVLPAAAEDVAPLATEDPYAKITGVDGGYAVDPDANVFFFDPVWAELEPAVEGESFEYTYGDGEEWGNGKTYNLIWKTNAFATMPELMAAVRAYCTKWVAAPDTVVRDIVVAFAVGEIGLVDETSFSALTSNVPTVDQLINVYFLGAQAGKNPVNDERDTKETAKAIQNGRSADSSTETVLTDTFNFPARCNFTLDGFAGSKNACLAAISADRYTNIMVHNYFVSDLEAPHTNMTFNSYDSGGPAPADDMWEFKNCYFNYNTLQSFAGTNYGNNGYDEIEANKIVFDNCFFTQPNTSNNHRLFLMPSMPTYATAAKNFLGEYAASPEITIKNCVGMDWGANRFIYLLTKNNRFITYPANSVKVNILNNKFYDVVGTKTTDGSSIFIANPAPAASVAHNIIIEGNVFSVSKEAESALTSGNRRFIEYDAEAVSDSTGANITYRDNIFSYPNGAEGEYALFKTIRYNSGNDNRAYVDFSGNFFVDLDGNVLPNLVSQFRGTGHRARSDLYVSAAMDRGVREVLNVKDIKGGAVIYNYISLDHWTVQTPQATWETASKVPGAEKKAGFTGNHFIGALTLLLERGKEYSVNDMFTFGSEDVVIEGVYATEACTGNKITTLTQDMFANDAKYYLKVTYGETVNGIASTATVVYCLNTPQEYVVIAPEGSSYDTSKKYTFNGITYENGKKASDGVTAKFFNQVNAAALTEYDFPSAVEGSPNSYYPGIYNLASDFSGNSMFLLTPGVHTTDTTNGVKNMESKSRAFIGPNFLTSPYGEENNNGTLAGGRSSTDATKEAIIDFCVRISEPDNPVTNTFYGVVFGDDVYSGISNNVATTALAVSAYQQLIVKNCVFADQSERLIQGSFDETNGKVVDVFIKDSAFDAVAQDRSEKNKEYGLFDFVANFVKIDNFALLNKYCAPLSVLTNVRQIQNAAWASARNGEVETSGIISYATSHIKATELTVDAAPTCGDNGSGHYECLCGTRKDMELNVVIPATGDHNLGKLEIDVNPVCNAAGIGHKDCTVCLKEIESEIEIPVDTTAHKWEDEYSVDHAATCLKAGSKSIHCTYCDSSKPGTTIVEGMVEHKWEETYTVDVESTCNFQGKESIHCELCDTVKNGTSRDLPVSDHVWGDKYIVDTPATCGKEGSKSLHCIYCNKSNAATAVVIEKTEHEWKDTPTVDKKATCLKDGEASYHCKNCDATKDAYAIPAEHSAITTKYITIPTYQKGGKMAKVCEDCGTVLESWKVDAVKGTNTATAFKDVATSDWFYKNDAINFVYNTGLMSGVGNGKFAPDETLTRGMFVTILGRLSGAQVKNTTTKFTDVKKSAYYSGYVAWAVKNGVVSGTSATTFAPNAAVTREQICTMIYRYCEYADITLEQSAKKVTFTDAKKISSYAKSAVVACQRSGLVNGEKTAAGVAFRPKDTATRAEAATIIRNLCYAYIIK